MNEIKPVPGYSIALIPSAMFPACRESSRHRTSGLIALYCAAVNSAFVNWEFSVLNALQSLAGAT